MNITKIRTGVFVVAIFLCLVAAPVKADWDLGDSHKMHFPQLPDPSGWDVASYNGLTGEQVCLTDDWLCTETGPVTDIHFWGSWKGDIKGEIVAFNVSIWSNDPGTDFSHPNELLWQHNFYGSEFTERNWSYDYGSSPQGWMEYNTFAPGVVIKEVSLILPDHNNIWQYNLHIDPAGAFNQTQGTIYWLAIVPYVNPDVNPIAQFGWKTSLDNWEDKFVVESLGGLTPEWEGIWYNDTDPNPSLRPAALAFVIARPPLLSCDCGDICVNETGWWRHNDTFNENLSTPIQAAVDNASAGETICVQNGTYPENVDVDVDNLTIKSQYGPAYTTVQAATTSDHVFHVTANYVNIIGLNVTGATVVGVSGIYLDNINNCTISNNTASGNQLGINLYASSFNNLTGNTVSNNTIGILIEYSSNNNISCNWVHHNTVIGIDLIGNYPTPLSLSNTIEFNNIIENGKYNSTSGGYEWNFENFQQSGPVEAKYNYWGLTGNDTIDDSIKDNDEVGWFGVVTFYPFEPSPPICAPIPEAATILLFSAGLVALAGYTGVQRRRSRK